MISAPFFLLALAQTAMAPAPAVEPQPPSEVVVIGQRARAVRWDWRVDRAGRLTMCRITRSSGDSEIDQIGCDATRRCGARGIRQARPMRACIISVRSELIEALADARVEARTRRLEDAQN